MLQKFQRGTILKAVSGGVYGMTVLGGCNFSHDLFDAPE